MSSNYINIYGRKKDVLYRGLHTSFKEAVVLTRNTSLTLRDADFTNADLSDINLDHLFAHDATFEGANLRGTSLVGAKLAGATFRNADLTGANLRSAGTCKADFTGAKGLPEAIPGHRKKVAKHILADVVGTLNMATWHCDTQHCLAGWAVHLGKNGYKLEEDMSTSLVARCFLGLLGKSEDDIFYGEKSEVIRVLEGWIKGEEVSTRLDRLEEEEDTYEEENL